MKRFLTAFTALILAAVLICAGASAFDANDYDYGGGGGGGFSYSHDSGDSIGGDLDSLLIAIVAVVILFIYWWIKDKIDTHRKKKLEKENMSKNIPDRTAEIQDAARRFDPGFNGEAMKTYANNTFRELHTALSARDLTPVRGVLSGQLFESLNSRLRDDAAHNITVHYGNISVKQSWLTSYVRENGCEYLIVCLNAKYSEYTTDDKTRATVKGSRKTECTRRFMMTFMRSTAEGAALPQTCPHCGAPMNAAFHGRCEYCGSAVEAERPRWLLSVCSPVDRKTQDFGIRIS